MAVPTPPECLPLRSLTPASASQQQGAAHLSPQRPDEDGEEEEEDEESAQVNAAYAQALRAISPALVGGGSMSREGSRALSPHPYAHSMPAPLAAKHATTLLSNHGSGFGSEFEDARAGMSSHARTFSPFSPATSHLRLTSHGSEGTSGMPTSDSFSSSSTGASSLDASPMPARVGATPAPLTCEEETEEEENEREEAGDDIHHALTKSALCSALFTLTRSGKMTLQQSNLLSKALCSSSRTLRSFEALLDRARLEEREMAALQGAWLQRQKKWNAQQHGRKRSIFFGNSGANTPASPASPQTPVFPEPSPLEEAQQAADARLERWVYEQMVRIMPASAIMNPAPVSPQPLRNGSSSGGGGGMHSKSSSDPSAPGLSPTPASAPGGTRPTVQPLNVLPGSTSHPRSYSIGGGIGNGTDYELNTHRVTSSASVSPALSSQSFSHSPSSFQQQPQFEKPLSVLSPRRLFRALFYSSHTNTTSAGGSAASSTAGTPRRSSLASGFGSPRTPAVGTVLASPFATAVGQSEGSSGLDLDHFEAFPRMEQLLRELLHAPLPQHVLVAFNTPPSVVAAAWTSSAAQGTGNDEAGTADRGTLAVNVRVCDANGSPICNTASASPSSSPTPAWLSLHPSFPYPVPSPLRPFASSFSRDAAEAEAAALATWNDVLLNFRKHIPLAKINAAAAAKVIGKVDESTQPRFSSSAGVLLDWWMGSWVAQAPPSTAPSPAAAAAAALKAASWVPDDDLMLPIGALARSPRASPTVVNDAVASPLPSTVSADPPSLPPLPDSPPSPLLMPQHLNPTRLDFSALLGGDAAHPRLSSPQLRLLLMMSHWLFLCPHDFAADARAAVRLGEFLERQKERFGRKEEAAVKEQRKEDAAEKEPSKEEAEREQPKEEGSDTTTTADASNDALVTSTATQQQQKQQLPQHPVYELLHQLQQSLQRCSTTPSFHNVEFTSPDPAGVSPSSPSSPLRSPLHLLPYPFPEEVEEQYSSSLFSYPPGQLAQELLLHSYDLFRRIPPHEWVDGAWQRGGGGAGGEEMAYSNAYSEATQASSTSSTPNPDISATAAAAASSQGAPTRTQLFISDFNRLVFWIATEILHPRLSSQGRSHLLLYFLELAFVSWHSMRNFHAVFAVAAAFANQAIYRLPEMQALANSDMQYNPSGGQGGGPTDSSNPPPYASMSVKAQLAELKSLTSSRNNYAVYRTLIATLMGDPAAGATGTNVGNVSSGGTGSGGVSMLRSDSSSSGSSISSGPWMGTSLQAPSSVSSTPATMLSPLGALSPSCSWASVSADAPVVPFSGASPRDLAVALGLNGSTNAAAGGGESATGGEVGEDGSASDRATSQSPADGSAAGVASPSPPDASSTPPPAATAAAVASAPITFVPHLAVHLKDLIYSQTLSGVETHWMDESLTGSGSASASSATTTGTGSARGHGSEEGTMHAQPDTLSSRGASPRADVCDALQSHSPLVSSSHLPSASVSTPPSPLPVLSCRFDRSRWRRTTRLIFQLLRFQSLPVFPHALPLHVPALYTLLQVHLLTHVLPEAELVALSYQILPKVDRLRLQQAAIKKKTLSALQEEGFM